MRKKKTVFDMGRLNVLPSSMSPLIEDQDLINLLHNAMLDLVKQQAQIQMLMPPPWLYPGGINYTSTRQPQDQQPDEESRFERDWRSQMPRSWKGWSQGDINKQTAKVWLDEGKGVLCARFPFKQSAIDEFREKIPKGKKAWNADDKLWEFSIETIDVIVDILTRNFDEVIDLTQAVSPSVTMTSDSLLSLLDKDDIGKIYKLLAKKYHPDVGGDTNKMGKINSIFSCFKGE